MLANVVDPRSWIRKDGLSDSEGVRVSAATEGRRKNESLQPCQVDKDMELGTEELLGQTCHWCMWENGRMVRYL